MNYGFAFFPGQGAQAPGMGKDLYENSQAAKLVFEEASEGAGLDVAKLCFESDKATLSRTENSQIAIFTHSMAAWAALKEAGVEFKAAAGFSLGEYTALAAADVVSLAEDRFHARQADAAGCGLDRRRHGGYPRTGGQRN